MGENRDLVLYRSIRLLHMEYTISWSTCYVVCCCLLLLGPGEVGSSVYPGARLLHESYCSNFPIGRLSLKCNDGHMIQIDDSIIFARDETNVRLRALGNHKNCAYSSRCIVTFQTYHSGFHWFNCLNVTYKCVPALCRPLRNPVFGSLSVTSYKPGSVVGYRCDQGFILSGSTTSKCVHHDNHYFWHPDPPVCEYNCRNLVHSPHPVGTYMSMCYEFILVKKKWSDARDYCSKNKGTLITYESMSFFQTGFDARPEIKLPAGVTWTSFWTSSEEYRPRYCKILYVNVKKTSDHYTRWLECSRNYYSICEYEPVHPKRCGQLPVPENGAKSFSNESIGTTVTFTCNVGYILNGTETRRCLSSGMWSREQPKCVDVDCGIPESFEDNTTLANVTYTSTNYLSFANYTCNAGHSLIGESVRMCTGNGTWSPAVPRCERITTTSSTTSPSTTSTTAATTTITLEVVDCGKPDTEKSPHLTIKYNTTTYMSVAVYSCQEKDTILVGNPTSFCTENSTWNGTIPKCVPLGKAVVAGQSLENTSSSVPGYVTAIVIIMLISTISAVVVVIVILHKRGKLAVFYHKIRTKHVPVTESLNNPTYMEVNTNGDVINQDVCFSTLNDDDETIYEEIPY